MATTVRLKRGTESAVNSYVGQPGELIIDTTNWGLAICDGTTIGGKRAVTTVNGIRPDSTGNINISAAYIGSDAPEDDNHAVIWIDPAGQSDIGLLQETDAMLANRISDASFATNSLATALNYGLFWYSTDNLEDLTGIATNVTSYYNSFNRYIDIPGGTVVIQSKANECTKTNGQVWINIDYTGTGSIAIQVSRDGGTTFTTCQNNQLTNIGSQPAGSSMVWKVTATGPIIIKNIALGCM